MILKTSIKIILLHCRRYHKIFGALSHGAKQPAAILTRLSLGYNCLANLKLHREAEEMSSAVVFVVSGVIKSLCDNPVPMEISKLK